VNLQEFIKSALTEVIAGVAEARAGAKQYGASVGSMHLYGHLKEAKVLTTDGDLPVSQIEFDIALADTSGTSTKGGIGVFLGSVGLGSQGASQAETTSHSRIKFSVPVVFPPHAA
jgi:hypothetical protein